jgi:hypothetical protein
MIYLINNASPKGVVLEDPRIFFIIFEFRGVLVYRVNRSKVKICYYYSTESTEMRTFNLLNNNNRVSIPTTFVYLSVLFSGVIHTWPWVNF